MDGHLLQQIQRELQAFEDRQLIALMELTVAELMERGILQPPGPPPEAPDTGNRGALDELESELDEDDVSP